MAHGVEKLPVPTTSADIGQQLVTGAWNTIRSGQCAPRDSSSTLKKIAKDLETLIRQMSLHLRSREDFRS